MSRKRNISDSNKLSMYLRNEVIARVKAEALRLDRPVSWIIHYCLRNGLDKVATLKNENVQLKSQQEE